MMITVLTMDDLRCAATGWRLSRDVDSHPDPNEIALVDAPVNELPSALLHFQDFMILEREIFASARNHVIWARTSRVDDPRQFNVPSELQIDKARLSHLRSQMVRDAEHYHQDIWRKHLPLSALTSWVARISYRDLVRLANYFDHLTMQFPNLAERFRSVRDELYEVCQSFTTVNPPFAFTKILFEGQPMSFNEITTNGFKMISAFVPIALRAQIIRHRGIQFVDNFFQLMKQPDILERTIGDHVHMELAATNEVWAGIMSKRSCWIAQHDLWKPIVERFDKPLLPCSGGVCPYRADAQLRFTDADPGAPCPVYCELNSIDKGPWLEAMRLEAQDRGAFWREKVQA